MKEINRLWRKYESQKGRKNKEKHASIRMAILQSENLSKGKKKNMALRYGHIKKPWISIKILKSKGKYG